MPFTPLTQSSTAVATPTPVAKTGGFTPITKDSLSTMPVVPPEAPKNQDTGNPFLTDVAVGGAKGFAKTAVTVASAIGSGLKKLGVPSGTFFTPSNEDIQTTRNKIEPQGTPQKVGSTAETVGEYLLGGVEKLGIKTGEGVAAKVAPVVGRTIAKYGGKTLAGVLNMYGFDTASNLKDGKPISEAVKPDTTDLGIAAAVPYAEPVIKGASKLAKESLGVSTGVGGGVIGKAWEAAKEGGDKLKAFKEGLGTAAESIVTEAKTALGDIVSQRNAAYQADLAKIGGGKSYDVTPVVQTFKNALTDYGVTIKNGTLDFSRSPALGRYEKDVKDMFSVLSEWGKQKGDRTLVGIDKLKQTIDQFRRGSAESKTLDSFVTKVRGAAKEIGKDNPTYQKMLKDYETSTGVIKEIQRGLSLGDKASVDTAFRKLTSALRTNNEFRAQLVKELDDASGGFLSSKIAGQQMSEILPRGLMRQLEGIGVGAGVTASALGVGIAKFIPAVLLTSPRAVQGMFRAIGLPTKLVGQLLKAIEEKAIGSKY